MTQATRTFRIFVSSTFPPSLELRRTGRDMQEERNALQKYVFPRLRELCARHACRFQAIDLRWGLPRWLHSGCCSSTSLFRRPERTFPSEANPISSARFSFVAA